MLQTARKTKNRPPVFKVECFTHGQWLWVIMPAFKTAEAAEAYIVGAKVRAPGSEYRVVPQP